jgi:hypothetical protein
VLTRAGRIFPVEPLRTLDAIHIATAELLGDPPQLITFVTRDERVAANARALGYSVLPAPGTLSPDPVQILLED